MKNETTDREPHALDDVGMFNNELSWEQRVKEWNHLMPFDQRMHWLHVNCTRDGNDVRQAIFLMDIADRYGESKLFVSEDNGIFTSMSHGVVTKNGARRKLSQKAFAVLANNFFRKTQDYCGFPYKLPFTEPLFSKLLWFFRPFGGLGGWDNLRPYVVDGIGKDGGGHYIEMAKSFATYFALNSWNFLNKRGNLSLGVQVNPTRRRENQVIMLMRNLGLEDRMQDPLKEVFLQMFSILHCERIGKTFDVSDLKNMKYVRNKVREFAKSGDPFSKQLYFCLLNL